MLKMFPEDMEFQITKMSAKLYSSLEMRQNPHSPHWVRIGIMRVRFRYRLLVMRRLELGLWPYVGFRFGLSFIGFGLDCGWCQTNQGYVED